jgi:preprotein translocase subunit SecA
MDDLRSGINLRGYAQRDPLVEYKREGFDMFERMMVEIDGEITRRIYKFNVDHHHHQSPQPVVDLSKISEVHEEALDEQNLLEDVGQLMDHTPGEGTTVKVEGSSNDESYNQQPLRQEPAAATKVTVEKGGQVVSEQVYGAQGQLAKQHGKIGRNDPCWCGSGKKYKKCHYPN